MQIGKYELLERLGAGGMAEVWRAQLRGAGGFVKQVALKLVLETWTDDVEVTQMLIDEAKLSASLDFPNIVSTLDFGFADGRYFIAMELVDGLPLSRCLRLLKHEHLKLELDLALHVAAETAAALAYAHTARDAAGNPLGIVHRDVNPSNIMVSCHGEVKLADFGIAKAAGRRTQTELGTLKGKYGYMSPEQARGQALDARCDVYAAGLTLLELVTLERPIDGANDIDTLERARSNTVQPPPAELPDGVRAVLGRALRAEPSDRFASAAAMREELVACLAKLPPRDVRAELGRLVDATRTGLADLKAQLQASPMPVVPHTRSERVTRPSTSADAPLQEPRSRWPVFVSFLLGCAVLGAGGVVGYRALEKPDAPAVTEQPTRVAEPAPPAPPPPATPAEPEKNPPPPTARHKAKPSTPAVAGSDEPATLRIQVVPWGNVWVDGNEAGQTPLTPLALRAGKHQVRVVHPDLGARQLPVELKPGEARLLTFDLSKGAP